MASGPAGAAEGPFPSTYRPAPAAPVAIVGATILTGTGAEIANATLLIRDGRVEAVGKGVAVHDGYTRVDGRGTARTSVVNGKAVSGRLERVGHGNITTKKTKKK